MPLVIFIWGCIIWAAITSWREKKKREEDEMWRRLGESMKQKDAERERLKNSYTIDD